MLPGDVGRNVLGPFASQQDVDNFNNKLGLDRPLYQQYWDWFSNFLHGDLGTSLQYNVPVSDLLGPAFTNSLKLAAVAFVLVVPLSILGGTISGLRRGRMSDRLITVTGLSLTAIPEFDRDRPSFSSRPLAAVAPGRATAPPGANAATRVGSSCCRASRS